MSTLRYIAPAAVLSCTVYRYVPQVCSLSSGSGPQEVAVDIAHVVFFYLLLCIRYEETCLPARLKCEVKQEVEVIHRCFDYSSSSSRRVDF